LLDFEIYGGFMVPMKNKVVRYLSIFTLLLSVGVFYQNCGKARFSASSSNNDDRSGSQGSGSINFNIEGPSAGSPNQLLQYAVSDFHFTPGANNNSANVSIENTVWGIGEIGANPNTSGSFQFSDPGIYSVVAQVTATNGLEKTKIKSVAITNNGSCLGLDRSFDINGSAYVSGEAGTRAQYALVDLNNNDNQAFISINGRCHELDGAIVWELSSQMKRLPLGASIISKNGLNPAIVQFDLDGVYVLTAKFRVKEQKEEIQASRTIQFNLRSSGGGGGNTCDYDELNSDNLKYYEINGIHSANDPRTIYRSQYHFYVRINQLMVANRPSYLINWRTEIRPYGNGAKKDLDLDKFKNPDQSIDYWLNGGSRYTVFAKVTREGCQNSRELSVVIDTANNCQSLTRTSADIASCLPPGIGQFVWSCECKPGTGFLQKCLDTSGKVVADKFCANSPQPQCTQQVCPVGQDQ